MGRRPDSTPAPRGRGATINPPSRFAAQQAEACDDGWHQEPLPPLRTRVEPDVSRSVISWNDSLSAPHVFDITGTVAPGSNTLTLLIDNSKLPPVGPS